MSRTAYAVAISTLLVLATTGCNDRTPWEEREATHVVVYRNARGLPDMATYCLGTFGFSAVLTDPPIVERLYDLDVTCDPNAQRREGE